MVSGNVNTVIPQGNWDGVISLAVTYPRGTHQAKHRNGAEQRDADK